MHGGGAPVTGVVLMAPSVVLSTADSVIWFGTTMACHVPCRGWYATNVPLPSPSQYMLVSALPVVAVAVRTQQVVQAGVRDARRGLELVVELVGQGPLDRDVGDPADRVAAGGEQLHQAGDQPAA